LRQYIIQINAQINYNLLIKVLETFQNFAFNAKLQNAIPGTFQK